VIFLVVLGVVAKWILPPLQQVSETRRVRISAALQKREEAPRREQTALAERERVMTEARAQALLHRRPRQSGADLAFQHGRQRARRSTTGWSRPPGPRPQRRVDEPVTSSSDGSTRSWRPPPSGCSAAASMSTSPCTDRRGDCSGRGRGHGHGRGSGLAVASYLAEVFGFLLLGVFIYRYVRPLSRS